MALLDSPKRGRPRKDDVMGALALRLPQALVADIDAYSDLLKEQLPGLNITRADAVRQLIAVGLRVEQERLKKEKSL
jgi:hypothetical protein